MSDEKFSPAFPMTATGRLSPFEELRHALSRIRTQERRVLPDLILLDGSAFTRASVPLPEDHWSTKPGHSVPPMPMRIGTGPLRDALVEMVRDAVRYAVRASTTNGTMDFDPDAMVQNMIVGLLGYWTEDGRSTDAWANLAE